jgi:RNA polymerase sigma factor (sigma-70 family)
LTDEELIALFVASDEGDQEDAWKAFIDLFGRRIRSACRFRMARYPEEIDDRVQAVFVRLCKDNCRPIREFEVGIAKMSSWVHKVAINECNSWLRSRDKPIWKPEAPGSGTTALDPVDTKGPDVLSTLTDDEDGRRLVVALADCAMKLDPKRQHLFIARLLLQVSTEGKVTMSEVGRLFGHSPQRTKYQLDATLAQLARCVEKKLALKEVS